MNKTSWMALGLAVFFAMSTVVVQEEKPLLVGSRSPEPDWPDAPDGLYDNSYAPANSSEGTVGIPESAKLVLAIIVILIPVLLVWDYLRKSR